MLFQVLLCFTDGLIQDPGRFPLLRIKVNIAAGFCKTVFFPLCRASYDLDPKQQISGHLPDNRQLLRILFPEKSFIRHSDVKQLADYRADATEMLRTTFPAKLLRHIRSKLHEGCSPFRIHFLYSRMKDQITPMCL